MNNLKFGVLLFGLIGLVGVFLPQVSIGGHSFSLWDAHSTPTSEGGGAHVYMVMAGYAVGALMGILAVAMAPMLRWQSLVALLGFALVLVKIRHGLPIDVFKGGTGSKLMGAGAYGGALCSLLSLIVPERAR